MTDRFKSFALLCGACLLTAPANSQPVGSPPSPPPGGIASLVADAPEMERLAPLAGTWRVDAETFRPRMNRWDATGSFSARFVRTFDGRYVESDLVIVSGRQGYALNLILSWDRIRREYRAIIRENVVGLIDVFEGQFEDDVLVLDNRTTGTAGPSMDGRVEPNRLRLQMEGADRFILYIDAWRGDRWVEGARFIFSRLAIGE